MTCVAKVFTLVSFDEHGTIHNADYANHANLRGPILVTRVVVCFFSYWGRGIGAQYVRCASALSPRFALRWSLFALRYDLLRRDQLPAIAQQLGHLVPVRRAVEVHTDPAAGPHIGRLEEAIRPGTDHQLLVVLRRLDPDRIVPRAMMVRRSRVHREDLALLDAERGRAPRLDFVSLRQREAEFAKARKR